MSLPKMTAAHDRYAAFRHSSFTLYWLARFMASLIGTIPAVVFGGLGTLAVAGLWAWWFPQLRKARTLQGRT